MRIPRAATRRFLASVLTVALAEALVVSCSDDPVQGNVSGGQTEGTTDRTTSGVDSLDDTGTESTRGSTASESDDGSTSATGPAVTSDTGDTGPTTGTDADTGTGGSTDTGTGTGGECSMDADCDDGLICTGVETCDDGVCAAGTPVACDDGVACTVDACDEDAGGICVALAQDSNCDNGLFCDGAEICDEVSGCMPGIAINCTDTVGCTVDSCDEAADACSFAPDHSVCSNSLPCDGEEICSPALGCIDGPDPNCNDQLACTIDSCDDLQGGCVHDPDPLPCQNGVFCDGEEVCNPAGGCLPGTPIGCVDDGHACTIEACNEALQACDATLDQDQCLPSEACTLGGCVPGTPCNDDTDCADSLACNGDETCGPAGICIPGTPPCVDAFACTIDGCDEPGTCTFTPLDGLCGDGDACNGVETCDPLTGCQPGTDLDCDDGVDCTIDLCAGGSGCQNFPFDPNCADGVFCNGEETCDPVSDCQPGTPVACGSDGIDCTSETCDDTLGGCISVPDDTLCACGETCSLLLGGCGVECNIALCDNKIWDCGDCEDNDGDCKIDSKDPECFGPCDNNEEGFKGEIPGQAAPPCKMDCYFDDDSGSGNDDCYWSHECDPLMPSADCDYDPDANIPGTSMTCAEALVTQSQECLDVCGPLVPNGCDCFGCCEVQLAAGGSVTVYLGSEDASGDGTCTLPEVEDPTECHPCTQVAGCLNPCVDCELCFGQTELPPECTEQDCPDEDHPPCGLPGQAPCEGGQFCVTGCCTEF